MNNVIVLVGMSGVGKSYHTRRLKKKYACKVFSIDDMIASAIHEKNVYDVAKFLGPPYSSQYKERSERYLYLEELFTSEALEYASTHPHERVVIDTTGSVVHVGASILKRIKNCKYSVFLDTDPLKVVNMVDTYIREPKPVIWGRFASQFSKDGYLKELQGLYPKLLEERRKMYGSISRYQVPYTMHKKKTFDLFAYLGLSIKPKIFSKNKGV